MRPKSKEAAKEQTTREIRMAIALKVQCEHWHREYCELYWYHNELQVIGTCYAQSEAKKVQSRMDELVRLLGYMPAA